MGVRVFNCYKASCAVHGATQSGAASVSDILSFLSPDSSRYQFTPPSYLTSWDSNNYAYNWLKRYPAAFMAVERGLVDALYDPKEHRLCFAYSLQGLAGLCGRGLKKGAVPKWRRYDKYPIPCVYGSFHNTGVLVEDAVSAAAVTATGEYSGIALLGTSISSGFTGWSKYNRMIVALDKDASSKAIAMQRMLSWFKPTDVCLLDKDLKCYTIEEIKKQLNAVQ